ncbi:MAG TPA: peptidoglycan recognition family protein [Vicinamibacteria bacterium]|nr:peptidoglycan recognition family protein [Vicinamibacteria bacterium]
MQRSAAPRPAATGLAGFGRRPLAALEARGRTIRDPVEKLRFLRHSIERFETLDERLQLLPGAPLRWVAYQLTGVEETRPLFSRNPWGALDPPRRNRRPLPRRARRTVNAAALLLMAAAGLALAGYPLRRSTELPASVVATPRPVATPQARLDPPRGGLTPERIWLVDSGAAFELYSNGLRIDTTWAVRGEPRRYRVFTLGGGMGEEVHDRPVGIVYHTSESDIWPLEESFNEKLRDSSQDLLRYLRRNQVYHYLVDRFGRVYRVVEEKDKANHAGMSVWAEGDRIYLNLNGPTIGVSFETRWEGGRALPITRAQLEAGRSLSDYLRHKWQIAPELCVTHGLASVNPKKHLIGHHLDWARGFPFDAFSLPDQYQVESPAVRLGFAWDERFLAVMNEPWPGAKQAADRLAAEAAATGRSVDEERKQRARGYDGWLAELTTDAETAEKLAAQAKRAASGG